MAADVPGHDSAGFQRAATAAASATSRPTPRQSQPRIGPPRPGAFASAKMLRLIRRRFGLEGGTDAITRAPPPLFLLPHGLVYKGD